LTRNSNDGWCQVFQKSAWTENTLPLASVIPAELVPTGYSNLSMSRGSLIGKPAGQTPPLTQRIVPAATWSPATRTPFQQEGNPTCKEMIPVPQLTGWVGLPDSLLFEQPQYCSLPIFAPIPLCGSIAFACASVVADAFPTTILKLGGNGTMPAFDE